MATYFRLTDVARQFTDASGNPYSGGKLYTYTAGTTSAKTSYKDSGGLAANTNPIVLDSAGRIPYEVWGTTGAYKLKLDTSADVAVWTRDDITGVNDSAASVGGEWVTSALTPAYISSTSFSLPGDQTTVFHADRRLKIVDSSGTDYATIITSIYTSLTTITVLVDGSGVLDAGMNSASTVSFSILSTVNTSLPFLFKKTAFSAQLTTALTVAQAGHRLISGNDDAGTSLQYDHGNNYDAVTNFDYTVPSTGAYLFINAVVFNTSASISDGELIYASIHVDGAEAAATNIAMGVAQAGFRVQCVLLAELTAAQVVTAKIYHTEETGTVQLSTASFFTGRRIA